MWLASESFSTRSYYPSSFIRYQALLQKNLMYLAAIADSQPPTPTIPAQMTPHPAMQQGAYFMQHPYAPVITQQRGLFPPKMPMQFGSPHQVHDPQMSLHQQKAIQGQMGVRAVGPGNGLHPLSAESLAVGGSRAPPPSSGLSDVRAGSKQDASDAGNTSASNAGNTSADVHGSAPSGHPGGDAEQSSRRVNCQLHRELCRVPATPIGMVFGFFLCIGVLQGYC